MTTNERLLAAGLLDSFGKAARVRNREEMKRLLVVTELPLVEAGRIVDQILEEPTRYGF